MSYDVYGIGNALVDMEFLIDDTFLRQQGVEKGRMTLVDEPRLRDLLSSVRELASKRSSGGSAANTMLAVQGFGGRTFYSCKVANDDVGAHFLEDLNSSGVETNPHGEAESGSTGRCLVFITPDAERSMNTFLGISQQLGLREVNEKALLDSSCVYIEGYLSSSPTAREAAIRCRELAERNGVETALTLSDPSMVAHFRRELTAMLGNGVDHLFCNEEEALDWARTDRLDIAVKELADIGRTVNVTLGDRGSLVATGRRQVLVPGFPVRAVDTNGAGDIYAGACLYAWRRDASSVEAARFGNFAAARLVMHYGARLENVAAYRSLLQEFESQA